MKATLIVIDFIRIYRRCWIHSGKGDNFSLGLGFRSIHPRFQTNWLDTLCWWETVDVIVTFPEDYQAADLAGKKRNSVTNDPRGNKEISALDDELAKTSMKKLKLLLNWKKKYRKGWQKQKYNDAVKHSSRWSCSWKCWNRWTSRRNDHEEVPFNQRIPWKYTTSKESHLKCTSKLLQDDLTNNMKQKLKAGLRQLVVEALAKTLRRRNQRWNRAIGSRLQRQLNKFATFFRRNVETWHQWRKPWTSWHSKSKILNKRLDLSFFSLWCW